jgi:fatty-acyl-CoA synthase
MSWNFGDIFDAVAKAVPGDTPALIHGDRTITWAELDRRSNNLARWLIEQGAQPDDKVAFYVRNRPEYVELLLACFKARLVHVNVNFRYEEAELHYVLENSDARFVLFAGEFGDKLTKLRDRLPKLVACLQVDDGSPVVPFAEPYEPLADAGGGAALELDRSADDFFFLYTGGTTGMPKGVMWRAEDLWGALGGGAPPLDPSNRPETLDEHVARIRENGPGMRLLPACPLMHGTGLFTAMGALVGGGSVVTLGSAHLDPDELWRAVEQHRVTATSIVGDAFGKPMLRALDERPGGYDLSSLFLIISSGVMWTPEVKKGLLRHHPAMVLVDSFGSSEAVGFGLSITTAEGETRTAKFEIGENVKVFTEEGREVAPGSGEPGYVARTGPIPSGYYKDPVKTGEIFRTIDGVRYSIPGDWCTVEEDGTLTLLGRGSVCINTGGEKVYPEEVEEVLKAHPDVYDALVVGVPDDKWGQAVTAVVQLQDGTPFDEETLRRHVRAELSGPKTPKRVLRTDRLYRAPNGKADYQATAAFARQELGIPDS